MERYDAHCHLFNMWFPIREAAAIAWDMILGEYPRKPRMRDEKIDVRKIPKLKDVLMIVRQIGQIISVFMGDYKDNYKLLQRKMQKIYGGNTKVSAIPLMMDIYFTFAQEYGDQSLKTETIRGNGQQEFNDWFNEAENILLNEARINAQEENSRKKVESYIHAGMKGVYQDIVNTYSKKRRDARIVMTPGFEKEIKQCISLQKRYTGNVYPFFAVDPRRTGVLDLIMDGSSFKISGALVSKSGHFYGIKLYPSLGYKPEECRNVLTWCGNNHIPVTVHASGGGYPEYAIQ